MWSGLGLRNGNQSPGGIVIPQTFPGTSNSTAIWKSPCCASGGWTHTTRACTECNNLFAPRSVTPRVSREFVLSFCFDGNLQPWLFTSRVAGRSPKGWPSKSKPVNRLGAEIGRAAWWGRGEISVGAGSFKKEKLEKGDGY